MKTSHKIHVLHVLGLSVCVVPPVITTLEYFPLWFKQTETAVSAFSAILILLCCLPFIKQIKAYFKGTPASWVIWLVLYIIVTVFSKLAEGVETVAFIGLLSNLLGGAIFRIEKHLKRKEGVKENE